MNSPAIGAPEEPAIIAYVGARTTPGRGTGVGITRFAVDRRSEDPEDSEGQREAWRLLDETPAVNPGWLVPDVERGVLIVAHGDQDYVSTYKLGEGPPPQLGTAQTQGTNPAHLALTPDGRFALVANHTSGTIVSIRLDGAGRPGEVAGRCEFAGTPGPHRSDQPGSKPHQVALDESGRLAAVPDKGLDTVFWCAIGDDGELSQVGSVTLRQGSGPRHVALHGNGFAYVLGELDNTVTVLDCTGAPERPPVAVQVHTTLPADDPRDSRGGEILLSADGRTLYASNRSGAGDKTPGGPEPDTIAVYRVLDSGGLEPLGHVSSHGIRPRFMTLGPGGEELYVANEKSGEIWRFALAADGMPVRPTRVARVASPVCIAFT